MTGRRVGSAFEIVEWLPPLAQRILAIDPGNQHCGMAWLWREWNPDRARHEWSTTATADMKPADCLGTVTRWLEEGVPGVLVVEGFQLYPNKMQEQGLSRMGTPEVIGALKWVYLCAKWADPRGAQGFREQGASLKMHGCRYMNEHRPGECGYETKAGKRTWTHDPRAHAGSNIHKRDAESHAWYAARKVEEAKAKRRGSMTTAG